ncbi:DUF3833 family protein [Chthonobacter rhizosphaerae]|uniref:DUF3833 family protein n=1 Tax=Chthonobacter rhizosphaerae TaxID=2735553 RepID=UPI0015EF892D|nr:DUF3833 family protein [Chthonobacter rhizosphaerae]
MPVDRRALGRFALGALLAPALPRAAAAADGPPLVLEDFFTGRTRGEGLFESDLAGVRRPFTVDTVGTFDGRTLILTEYIAYADGQKETAVWRFDKTGPATYDGQRSRVAGVVPVRAEGGVVRMGYVAEVTGTDGKPLKLRFEDTLRLIDETTLLNTAAVRFLGLTVGKVEVTFLKRR